MTRTAAHPRPRTGPLYAFLALGLAAALAGCSAQTPAPRDHGPAGNTKQPAEQLAAKPAEKSAEKGAEQPAERAAAPVRVAVPSLGIDSPLMGLGLNKDGTVEVPPPEKGMTAGWYTRGAVPGERGASVIIGHNSTRYGKAVFHDLKDVDKGAEISVRDAAGKTVRFTVTRTETVRKKTFPTERVYGRTQGRELRLITCDGAFDAEGHTVDNLIVYAARA